MSLLKSRLPDRKAGECRAEASILAKKLTAGPSSLHFPTFPTTGGNKNKNKLNKNKKRNSASK